MKVTLLVVGPTVDAHFAAAISGYVDRLKHYLSFQVEVVAPLRNAKSLSREQIKAREGELITKAISLGDYIVLLDEGGRELRSVELADFLQRRMNAADKRLVFVVGGAYGFSPEVYRLAHEKLSLSRLTFSHQMVRLVFVEQLYRAMTILHHEPYHHE